MKISRFFVLGVGLMGLTRSSKVGRRSYHSMPLKQSQECACHSMPFRAASPNATVCCRGRYLTLIDLKKKKVGVHSHLHISHQKRSYDKLTTTHSERSDQVPICQPTPSREQSRLADYAEVRRRETAGQRGI